MTDIYEIIDTAVKISLGAVVGGVMSWILARQAEKYREKSNELDSTRSLIKDLALNVEVVAKAVDDVAHFRFNENTASAIDAALIAVKEVYRVRAIAAIVGFESIISSTEIILRNVQKMYHLLQFGLDDIDALSEIDSEIEKQIQLIHSEVGRIYKTPVA